MHRYTPANVERTAKREKDSSNKVTFLTAAALAASLRDNFYLINQSEFNPSNPILTTCFRANSRYARPFVVS